MNSGQIIFVCLLCGVSGAALANLLFWENDTLCTIFSPVLTLVLILIYFKLFL